MLLNLTVIVVYGLYIINNNKVFARYRFFYYLYSTGTG